MAIGIELDCEGIETIVPFEQNTELQHIDSQIQKIARYVFATIATMTAAGIAAVTWLSVFSITLLCATPVALIAQGLIGNSILSSLPTTDRGLQGSIVTCGSTANGHDLPALFNQRVLDPIHSAPLLELREQTDVHQENSFAMKTRGLATSTLINQMYSKQPWISVSVAKANILTSRRLSTLRQLKRTA